MFLPVCLFILPSGFSSVRYQTCKHDIFETNGSSLIQIGTNHLPHKSMKQ